jgi:hypothetical protein
MKIIVRNFSAPLARRLSSRMDDEVRPSGDEQVSDSLPVPEIEIMVTACRMGLLQIFDLRGSALRGLGPQQFLALSQAPYPYRHPGRS